MQLLVIPGVAVGVGVAVGAGVAVGCTGAGVAVGSAGTGVAVGVVELLLKHVRASLNDRAALLRHKLSDS